MSRIGIFSFGRKQSTRCPDKMLRPFAGTTLTDIVLSKLARFGEQAFFAGHEDEFRVRCDQHGVRFVPRSLRSATIDEPIVEILGFLQDVDFDFVLLVSACAPFLRVETIQNFLQGRGDSGWQPAISVRLRRSHFLTPDRRALNFDLTSKTLNTKVVQPVVELVDGLYFFDRRYFLCHGRYWDWQEVRFFELNENSELFDVDSEADFVLAEAFWRASHPPE